MWASIVLIVYLALPGELTVREVWIDIEKCGEMVQMGPIAVSAEVVAVNKWKREHDGWTVARRMCLDGRLS